MSNLDKIKEEIEKEGIPDPSDVNVLTEELYNKLKKQIDDKLKELDKNKNGRIEASEFWAGVWKGCIKTILIIVSWLTAFVTLMGFNTLTSLSTIEAMFLSGEWSWQFIWETIISGALASMWTFWSEKRKITKEREERLLKNYKDRAELAELHKIADEENFNKQYMLQEARHQIELMAKDLKITEEEFQKIVKGRLAYIEIKMSELMESKIKDLEEKLKSAEE